MNINKITQFHEWPKMTQGLMIGLLCAILFYIGYVFDLESLRTQLGVAKQQETEAKNQLTLLIDKQAKIKQELTQSSELIALLKLWQSKMIHYTEFPELINEILKLGAINNLHFSSFVPGSEITDQQYIKVPIKVTVVGSYHQLALFISQLANLPHIIMIGNFIFSRENKDDALGARLAEQANAENLLTADMTLTVFRLSGKKA